MKRSILMCPVEYFEVVYRINPWMHPENRVNNEKAQTQWKDLVDIYIRLGLDPQFITPVRGLPDMVFAANGFFSLDGKAIVARFRYKERQGETKHYANWLKQNSHLVIDPGKVVYEGEGDTFLVDDRIYQGWGFRSDKQIIDVFTKTYPDKTIIPLHLIDDRFYHLDTCFFPVSESRVYYFKKAFDKESVKVIQETFCNLSANSVAFVFVTTVLPTIIEFKQNDRASTLVTSIGSRNVS